MWRQGCYHGGWWSDGQGDRCQAGYLSSCLRPLLAWGNAEEDWAEWAASGEPWKEYTQGVLGPHAEGMHEQNAGVASTGQDGIRGQNAELVARSRGEDAAYEV